MKDLYAKFQSNKHLFVIPLLILVLALYFLPTFIQFEYSISFNNEIITQPSYCSGWFYGWLRFERITSYQKSNDVPSTQIYLFCIVPVISTLIACIFTILSYKNLCFLLGGLIVPIQNYVYIGLYKNILFISAKENAYLAFSIVLNIALTIVIMFLFCLPFLVKEKRKKLSKTDRIAELEKQVADLQAKVDNKEDTPNL